MGSHRFDVDLPRQDPTEHDAIGGVQLNSIDEKTNDAIIHTSRCCARIGLRITGETFHAESESDGFIGDDRIQCCYSLQLQLSSNGVTSSIDLASKRFNSLPLGNARACFANEDRNYVLLVRWI
jgi:hypothetical protein